MKTLLIALLLATFNAYADCVPSYIAGNSGCGSSASAGAYNGNAYNRAEVRANMNSYLHSQQAPVYDNQPHYNDAEHDVNRFDAQEVEDAIRDAREEAEYDHDTLMKIRQDRASDLRERLNELLYGNKDGDPVRNAEKKKEIEKSENVMRTNMIYEALDNQFRAKNNEH